MKSPILLLIVLLFAFLITAQLFADVPKLVNYQGRLTSPDGGPIEGPVDIVFTIYDDSSSGTAIWQEQHAGVVVSDGLFDVLLGSTNPVDNTVFSSVNRWLGIKVGSEAELTPRTRLITVPYAYCALVADTAMYASQTAPDAVGGINVIDSSLFADDIGDEPGVSRVIDYTSVDITLLEYVTVLEDSILCPASGYVLVIGEVTVSIQHTQGEEDHHAIVGVTNNPTSNPLNRVTHYFPNAMPSGLYQTSFSNSQVFPVSPGMNKFYIRACHSSDPGLDMKIATRQLTLLFIPSAYGPITP